ncbi:hypothetical protein ACQKQD_33630 [Methylobacterium sp. NPDC080182]|uniref:hypothetical protein n=1 Tax=Methylobacterium sp. NPDC080182 TaxID=3390590 RepID=UPI003CFE2859
MPRLARWIVTVAMAMEHGITATAAWLASTSSAGVAAVTASPIGTAAVGAIIAAIASTETA